MQTRIHPKYQQRTDVAEAEQILRSCVHCGFCLATCPTYLELGDERDSPRGRIYLIKQLLEEGTASNKTQRHLDRCLTCRACETTCPSGVEYGRLVDFGRHTLEQEVTRPMHERFLRRVLLSILPYRRRFGFLLSVGQFLKPILPGFLAREIPAKQYPQPWPQGEHGRTMLVLGGCAQAAATPNTNASTARVLDRLGVTLVDADGGGCCGAASYHLCAQGQALDFARRNIDAWWPLVEQGAEHIVITASGCGTMVKDYGELLKDDPHYAQKARQISAIAKDISEILAAENLAKLELKDSDRKPAVHCPCSLQHGQQLPDALDSVLAELGIETARTMDKHLCCGSAGTYSILQRELSRSLLDNKLKALSVDNPGEIVTANVGCQMHLGAASSVPVRHWIELIDELSGGD